LAAIEMPAKSVSMLYGARLGERDRSERKSDVVHQDGVAVGSRLGDRVRADRAARPAAVLDHRGLAQGLGHALRDQARDDVGRAARGERNDDAHGP